MHAMPRAVFMDVVPKPFLEQISEIGPFLGQHLGIRELGVLIKALFDHSGPDFTSILSTG